MPVFLLDISKISQILLTFKQLLCVTQNNKGQPWGQHFRLKRKSENYPVFLFKGWQVNWLDCLRVYQ